MAIEVSRVEARVKLPRQAWIVRVQEVEAGIPLIHAQVLAAQLQNTLEADYPAWVQSERSVAYTQSFQAE